MARISPGVAAVLRAALTDAGVIARYRSHIAALTATGCRLWTGAIAGRGHARFWIGELPDGRDAVVLGHRFGYGLAFGYDELIRVSTVRHYICDNPLCQTVDHLRAGSNADNAHDWSTRRHTPGSPLRDTRGALGRARAIRAAARADQDLAAAAAAGLRPVDRDQPPLPDLAVPDPHVPDPHVPDPHVPDPHALGEEALEQVTTLTLQLQGPDLPGETYFDKIGRSENAKLRAEEIVTADLLAPPPELQDLTEDESTDILPHDEVDQTLTELQAELKKLADE
ncbi:hypothetical protein [Microlunatus ginsengisoli]|uniref:HNH nuclease domain-containing protein n=1 Tax=Microlunatus ginsengisoli TaxID=363863 RepID=A0ABP6ZL30_9ACTN